MISVIHPTIRQHGLCDTGKSRKHAPPFRLFPGVKLSVFALRPRAAESGTEVVYDLPEEYEEEEPRVQSFSPATIKQYKDELEKDMEEMSSGSDPYDPTGKTPEELDAMIAKYHRT
jgi:hypothetical protein